jgi:hypothetical protein
MIHHFLREKSAVPIPESHHLPTQLRPVTHRGIFELTYYISNTYRKFLHYLPICM